MKIVNICMNAPFTEGYSYQDNLLTEYQKKLGHDVTVITSTRTRGENGGEIRTAAGERVLSNGVRLIRIDCPSKLCSFVGYYPEIPNLIGNLQPDLVFIHGLCSLVPGQVIRYKKSAAKRQVHIVADNHQDSFNTNMNDFPFKQQIRVYQKCWKRWIKHIDRVYGTTSWRVSFAKDFYGILEEKLDILTMGIDSEKLPKAMIATRMAIRKNLDIPRETFVFITGGKLDSRKAIIEMMEAFCSIRASDAVFLIFGSVSLDVEVQFKAMIGEDERIKFIGFLPSHKIKEYLLAADFGVFAGGHSVLWEESIGCGLPCLFRKYEERDHVEVCGNCVSLQDPDVTAIADVMKRVISDQKYYMTMKEASVQASKDFSYWRIAEKSIEVAYESKQ